jgi:hypothetical protein
MGPMLLSFSFRAGREAVPMRAGRTGGAGIARRCGQTHPGTLANDGGPGRLDRDMMPIMINPSIDRHFFRKARMFRAVINLSQRAIMRLRQSGGTDHPCGDSHARTRYVIPSSSEGFHGVLMATEIPSSFRV